MILHLLPWMLVSFFMFFFVQIVNLVPAYVMSYIVDVVIPQNNLQLLVLYVLLYIAVPLVSGIGSSLYVYYTAVKCRKSALDLNQRIFHTLLCQNMTFYSSNPGGELAAKVMQDVSDYVYLWICTIPQAISSMLSIGVIFVVIGTINIYVALVQALFIVLLLLPVRISGKIIGENSKKLFGAIVKARFIVSEAFSGILTVKAMGLEKKILRKYAEVYEEGNRIFGRAVAIETVSTNGIREFLSAVFLGIAFIQCVLIQKTNAGENNAQNQCIHSAADRHVQAGDDNSSQLCGQPGHESQLAQHHHNRIPLGRRGGQQFLARTLGGFQLSVDCIYRI